MGGVQLANTPNFHFANSPATTISTADPREMKLRLRISRYFDFRDPGAFECSYRPLNSGCCARHGVLSVDVTALSVDRDLKSSRAVQN